jgi:hypothetical protein
MVHQVQAELQELAEQMVVQEHQVQVVQVVHQVQAELVVVQEHQV